MKFFEQNQWYKQYLAYVVEGKLVLPPYEKVSTRSVESPPRGVIIDEILQILRRTVIRLRNQLDPACI
jgi:hypothetical protein